MDICEENTNPCSDWCLQKLGFLDQKKRLRLGLNSVGRHSSSDFQVSSFLVSRHHAEITIPFERNKTIELKDLNSTNGTFINNNLIRAATSFLTQNDLIGFGAQHNNDNFVDLPIYCLKFEPQLVGIVDEIVISDDENVDVDVKPDIPLGVKNSENIAADQVLNIFGEADEYLLNRLQSINPGVCEAVKNTANAEVISLFSDEEDNNTKPPSPKTLQNAGSPDIFETLSEEEQSDSEGAFMFSQMLLDEMKLEMKNHDDVSDANSDTSLIPLSDDDNSEDDKLSQWTNKLVTSQIYPKLTFDVEDCNFEDETNIELTKLNSQQEEEIVRKLFEPNSSSPNGKLEGQRQSPVTYSSDEDSEENEKKIPTNKQSPILKEKRILPLPFRYIYETILEKNEKKLPDIEDSPILKKRRKRSLPLIYSSDENSEKDERKKATGQHSPFSHFEKRRTHLSTPKVSSNKPDLKLEPPNQKSNENKLMNPTKKKACMTSSVSKKSETLLKNSKYLMSKEAEATSTSKTSLQSLKSMKTKDDEIKTIPVNRKIEKKSPTLVTLPMSNIIPSEKIKENNDVPNLDVIKNHNIKKQIIRKHAERARQRNAPKKLRFADVEKSFEEKLQLSQKRKLVKEKIKNISISHPSSIPTSNPNLNLIPSRNLSAAKVHTQTDLNSNTNSDLNAKEKQSEINLNTNLQQIATNTTPSSISKSTKPKKHVRFQDVPTIHYFESDCSNGMKVDRKDLMPRLSFNHRRLMMRRNFPIVDRTDSIISIILGHCKEYLMKHSTQMSTYVGTENLLPMPTKFRNFEHYKQIIFPLMKLEFISVLKRENEMNAKVKPITVQLENVVENKGLQRLLLETTFTGPNNNLVLLSKKFDLVLLYIGEARTKVFAYVIGRNAGVNNKIGRKKLFFEILSNDLSIDYLRRSKTISVQAAMDNLQVTIGAYNALYQLEFTPLSEMILDPEKMLEKCFKLPKQCDIKEIAKEATHDAFNDEQCSTITNIFRRICLNKSDTTPNISLIQGPPGTGKSIVIVNLAIQLIYGMEEKYRDKKILICAQSNCAIDALAFRLLEARWKIKDKSRRFQLVRFGMYDRMDPKVHPISLKNVLEFERVKKLNHNLNSNFENAEKYKRHLRSLEEKIKALELQVLSCPVSVDKLQAKKQEVQLLVSTFNTALNPEQERIICQRYLSTTNIVCTTLSSSVKLSSFIDYFDVCIIDEATQCTEPWTLLPLKFGISSLILVGDSQQLPATVISKQASENGLSRSLFTRIENCVLNLSNETDKCSQNLKEETTDEIKNKKNGVIHTLRLQYRMHPDICEFPNKFFYKNTLLNGNNTVRHITPLVPFSILNLDYSQNANLSIGKIMNNSEADFVAELLRALNEFIPASQNSYGVITPYAHHRKILTDAIATIGLSHVTVNTIDSYQGSEKDVIIISNARTNGVGFLSNSQRLNVAITRPKKCLIICGNFQNLLSVPAWRCLLLNAKQRKVYYEINQLDISDIKNNVIQRFLVKK